MIKPLLVSAILFVAVRVAFGQDVYRTINGDIALSISRGDSVLLVVSNHLLVDLDYETSKVNFHVPYFTFYTGIDSLDRRLAALRDTSLEFSGKLSITINPLDYGDQKYKLEGKLTVAGISVPVRGSGSMACIPAGDRLTPACTLLLSAETTLSALHLSDVFPRAGEGVRIDLRQSILEKGKN